MVVVEVIAEGSPFRTRGARKDDFRAEDLEFWHWSSGFLVQGFRV